MFGTSGVRGRVGETITADLALDIGRALVTDGADTVVLGRDARESGRTLSRALSAGVTECGGDVIDVGVQPTPTVARSVVRKGPTPASSSPPHTTPRPTTGSSSGRPTGGHSTKTKTTESPRSSRKRRSTSARGTNSASTAT